MRTTIDIPDGLAEEARDRCDLDTKREAVVLALNELIRKAKREEFVRRLGTHDYDFTRADLERLRSDD